MTETEAEPHAGWSEPRPAATPRPTYWPAVTAFGVTFMLWGIVTSPVVLGAGGVSFCIALIGWIGELRHDPEE